MRNGLAHPCSWWWWIRLSRSSIDIFHSCPVKRQTFPRNSRAWKGSLHSWRSRCGRSSPLDHGLGGGPSGPRMMNEHQQCVRCKSWRRPSRTSTRRGGRCSWCRRGSCRKKAPERGRNRRCLSGFVWESLSAGRPGRSCCSRRWRPLRRRSWTPWHSLYSHSRKSSWLINAMRSTCLHQSYLCFPGSLADSLRGP